MKKNKLASAIIVSVAMIILSTGTAMADGMSSYAKSPRLTAGSNTATTIRNFSTSYSTVKGPNTWTYFNSFGTLSTKFSSNSNRIMKITLKEYDAYPNAADPVKEYTAKFDGRRLKEIKYEKLLDEGNIDSANDKTAELYLNIYFKQVNGDSTLNVPSGLFSYKYGIN